MSVKVQSKVWEHSRATGNTLIVLLKLSDCCDDQGRNAWPSIRSLARYCRCSASTVKRAIRELVDLGELEIVQSGGGRAPGSRYGSNVYRVVIETYQNDPPRPPRGRSPVNHGWFKSAHRGGSPVTPNSITNSSMNPEPSTSSVEWAAHLAECRAALGVERSPSKVESAGSEPGVGEAAEPYQSEHDQ